jgi:hypothetical protein
MPIKQIDLTIDRIKLEEFFLNCNTSDDYRGNNSYDDIFFLLEKEPNYRAFGYFNEHDEILSIACVRELEVQKLQLLDIIFSKKGIPINLNGVGKATDAAVEFGERKGIFRFYTFLTDSMLSTVDVLKKENKIFTWRQRYDTVVDEIIDVENFSNYGIHWNFIMNGYLRKQKRNVRHHHLKPEFIKQYYDNKNS